jgi:hypothetical protein
MSVPTIKNHNRSWRRRFSVALVAIAAVVFSLVPMTSAHAFAIGISNPVMLNSAQGRTVSAAWSGSAPFAVSFGCNVAGCNNYSSTSTTLTSVSGYAEITTCSPVTKSHSIYVRDKIGTEGLMNSSTSWRAGSFC